MKRKLFVVAIMALMVLSFATAASASVADELGPGTHSVQVDLYHATEDQLSMGDPAIVSPASITVANGIASMTLEVEPMTYEGSEGYLEDLQYWNGSGYSVATIGSYYDDGITPKTFVFPLIAATDILNEEEEVIGAWQNVFVKVHVEGGYMPDSPARLKIIF